MARPAMSATSACWRHGQAYFSGSVLVHTLLELTTALLLTLFLGQPAMAQVVSGSVSLDSDFRMRGFTYSAGRPVASVRIGVDDDSGIYADGSALAVFARDGDVRFLGYQVDAGVSRRVGDGWTLDAGVAHNDIREAYEGAFAYHYTEGYIGAAHGPLSAYVFVSPNYFRPGFWTLYGQFEANVSPADHWHLIGHLGSLNYLATPYGTTIRHYTYYDWRLGVARDIGRIEVHTAVSGGGPGKEYYEGQLHHRTALTAGASVSF